MATNDGSWFDLEPSPCHKKGVLRVVTEFYPTPYQCLNYLGGASHSLSQHEHTLIVLYQGKASQLSICLKADVIILQSDQVDEDLSHWKGKDLSSFSA